jgi:chaperonin GroEL
VCATRAALEEGILPGGGAALYHASIYLFRKNMEPSSDEEHDAAAFILYNSLTSPIATIMINSGKTGAEVDDILRDMADKPIETGYDVIAKRTVDMYASGIIDPAKVTTTAFKNALSVAEIVLQTNCIITNKRDLPKNEE